ncbi:MAG: AAA family ATPase [Planctomycetes bacterium]|nr:AAA family ATPase [Planctomycetota bacterium]
METTPQILVVGSDPLLRGEIEAAVASLRRWRPVLHFVQSSRQAIEAARNRRPDIVCVQIEADPRSLKTFAEEIGAVAPGTAVVALYRPENLGFGENEHQIIIEAMRAQVQDFLRRPLTVPEMQQLLDRLLRRPAEQKKEMGKVISIVSNKGGVGKSTVSVSVACALAKRLPPGKVLLIDASLHLGSCAPMLDLTPSTGLASAAREKARLDETLVRKLAVRHECGLDLLAAPIDAVDAADIDDEAMSRTITLARRSYDYVLVDTFPMLDGLIMAVLDLSDRAYVVVQNTVPNVVGAARLLPVLEHLGFPKERTRVILNNNFEKAPGTLSIADVEGRLDRAVDHELPYQKKLITALNTGQPYVLHATQLFGFGKAIKGVVDDLVTAELAPQHERETTPEEQAAKKVRRAEPGFGTASNPRLAN